MQQRQATTPETGDGDQSPVDDYTYDLLQALTSKLEAIEAYNMYAEDEQGSDLFRQLARDDRQHAERLLDALRQRLAR
jgi:hypothetical protein